MWRAVYSCSSPVTTTPVAAAPDAAAAVMPTPVAAAPTPVAATVPAPMTAATPTTMTPPAMVAAAPAHFLGLEVLGLLLRGHGRLGRMFRQFRILIKRLRHQWRCLRSRGECSGASEDTC